MSDAKKQVIAVCGKGGVGKTACTALIARALVESRRAGKLLLIDADPAIALPATLGVPITRTIGQVREEIIKGARDGQEKVELAAMIDFMVMEAMSESEHLAMIAMGRGESQGCFCPVNNILRDAIDLLARQFDTILIDGEAGLEQINRQVMRHVDTLIVLSDSSHRGVQTVAHIKRMVDEEKVLQCDHIGVIFNRVQGGEDRLREAANNIGIEVFGFVPADDNVARFDFEGRPLWGLPADTPSLSALREVVNTAL